MTVHSMVSQFDKRLVATVRFLMLRHRYLEAIMSVGKVMLTITRWDEGSDTLIGRHAGLERQFKQIAFQQGRSVYRFIWGNIWVCFLWGQEETQRLGGGTRVTAFLLTEDERKRLHLNRPGVDLVAELSRL